MTSRFVFMNDPSLACKETKKRGQLMSEVNAHNSRWRHSGSGSRGESQQNTIEEAVARGHRVRIVTSQNQSAVSRVRTSQSSIPLKVPMNLVPVTSPYLTQVYTGSSVTRISRLFDIYINLVGPIYVWRGNPANSGHSPRRAMLRWFISEPLFAESMLAFSQYFDERQIQGLRVSATSLVLFHHTRALILLRKALSSTEKAMEDSTFWAVFTNIVLNHEVGDTTGFQINVQGLRHLVELRGGESSLTARHGPDLARTIKSYINTDVESKTASTVEVASNDATSANGWPPSLRNSVILSPGVAKLISQNQLHKDVSIPAFQAIAWLREDEGSEKSLHEGYRLRQELTQLLDSGQLLLAEHALCLGLLVLCFDHISTTTTLREEHPFLVESVQKWLQHLERLALHANLSWHKTFDRSCTATSEHVTFWALLSAMSLLYSQNLDHNAKWSLLLRFLSASTADQSWSDLELILTDFYSTTDSKNRWRVWWSTMSTQYWILNELGVLPSTSP